MEKTVAFYKKHYELINYIVLTLLLAVSCFVKNFVYVAVGFAMFVSLFYNIEKNLKQMLFCLSFEVLFRNSNLPITLFYLIALTSLFKIGVVYLIDLIKKNKKINIPLAVVCLAFIVYLLLPIHQNSFSIIVMFSTFLLMIYLLIEYRTEINFAHLVNIFCLGIIVSGAMSLLKFCAPYLNSISTSYKVAYDYVRFQAMLFHPNVLASTIIMALSCLTFLFYANKIKFWQFLLYFLPLYVFGILTISRMFVVAFAVLIVMFTIFYSIKNKKKAIKPLLILALCLIICSACLFYQIKILLIRADAGITTQTPNFTDEEWAKIFAGEMDYDPGRLGIWKIYLKDWSSSIKTILFGRGISRPPIGKIAAHNTAIQFLWYHGIVGYLLMFAIIIVIALKLNFKSLLPIIFITFLPMATSFLLDPIYSYQKYSIIILLITILNYANKPNKEVLNNG